MAEASIFSPVNALKKTKLSTVFPPQITAIGVGFSGEGGVGESSTSGRVRFHSIVILLDISIRYGARMSDDDSIYPAEIDLLWSDCEAALSGTEHPASYPLLRQLKEKIRSKNVAGVDLKSVLWEVTPEQLRDPKEKPDRNIALATRSMFGADREMREEAARLQWLMYAEDQFIGELVERACAGYEYAGCVFNSDPIIRKAKTALRLVYADEGIDNAHDRVEKMAKIIIGTCADGLKISIETRPRGHHYKEAFSVEIALRYERAGAVAKKRAMALQINAQELLNRLGIKWDDIVIGFKRDILSGRSYFEINNRLNLNPPLRDQLVNLIIIGQLEQQYLDSRAEAILREKSVENDNPQNGRKRSKRKNGMIEAPSEVRALRDNLLGAYKSYGVGDQEAAEGLRCLDRIISKASQATFGAETGWEGSMIENSPSL